MKRLFAFIGALCGLSCTELNARWNDHQVFFGTVREPSTGATLKTFCAESSADHSEVVVFSASTGAIVEEEVFVEGRTEKYTGTVPPERETGFWCTDAPQFYQRPANHWTCLRAADDDPPAAILSVEPRGEMGPNGSSSGYALELQVLHPGVLHVILDEQCLGERTDAGVDGGAPMSQGELTIQ